jgi:hypothetical protein
MHKANRMKTDYDFIFLLFFSVCGWRVFETWSDLVALADSGSVQFFDSSVCALFPSGRCVNMPPGWSHLTASCIL